jgi:hypothetical protein
MQRNKSCLIDVSLAGRNGRNDAASEVLARAELLLVGQVASVVKF